MVFNKSVFAPTRASLGVYTNSTGTFHPSSNRKAKTLWITKITRSITNLLFLRVGFLNQFYSQQSVWTPRNPCLSLTTY